MRNILGKTGFVTVAFFASLFCVGLFYEYVSCIASVCLALWLLIEGVRKKRIVVRKNLTVLSVAVIVVFYGLSVFWATDSGMAFIGFVKYLPLLLFAMCFMQSEEKEVILTYMPYVAGVMMIISAILAQIPVLSKFFLVAGRLGGFFQYPNTFAMFLLVSELLLITKKSIKLYDVGAMAVLLAGVVYTGSRTVFVIAILANIAAILFTKTKRFIFYSILAVMGGGFVAVVYLIATDNTWIFERLLNISFTESTFVGRILYWTDALPFILKHPLGTGYMGYYYTQSAFQTGVYSVAFIHNDFLQLMLDIGWLPTLLFVFVIFKKVFSKNTSRRDRIILLSLFIHSMFDFDLQYLSMFFMYLLFLGLNEGKEMVFKTKVWASATVSVVVSCVSLYMCTSLLLYKACKYESSYAMYPWNVNTETALLTSSEDIERSNEIAEKMLKRNDDVLLGYCVKARYAYSQGDFGALIQYKNKIFEVAPFQYDEYEEYARMLINGIALYTEAGDTVSADYCKKELMGIPQKLDSLNGRLSKLGKLIKDQPKTELPDVLLQYIESLGGVSGE